MQTRGYVAALLTALAVLLLQLWAMRQANWIQWHKAGTLLDTSVQYGPLRTCSRLVVHVDHAVNPQQLGLAASVPASTSAAAGAGSNRLSANSSSSSSSSSSQAGYPTYTGDLLASMSDRLAHPTEKDDGWVCRPFPQTDKDCTSEGDRAFCNAFLSAGYSLQLSGILLIGSIISSLLTIFSHSPLNKVEGYRVVSGLMGIATLLGIVAYAIVVDAYKNDWPYLFGASLSLGPATYVELVAWLIGLLATLGLLVVGFRAERGARTGSAPVDGYTRI